jgi:hypothetical protein
MNSLPVTSITNSNPLRVPRLGTNEVKGYLILLLADLAQRRGLIHRKSRQKDMTRLSALSENPGGRPDQKGK